MTQKPEPPRGGQGRSRVRRGRPLALVVLVALVALLPLVALVVGPVGERVATRSWERFDWWLWDAAHLTAGTVVGGALIVTMFTWLWRISGD